MAEFILGVFVGMVIGFATLIWVALKVKKEEGKNDKRNI